MLYDEDRIRVGAHERELRNLLLGYLCAAGAPAWPGADVLTVADVLLSYPQAASAGLVPDLEELRRRHPELAYALASLGVSRRRSV